MQKNRLLKGQHISGANTQPGLGHVNIQQMAGPVSVGLYLLHQVLESFTKVGGKIDVTHGIKHEIVTAVRMGQVPSDLHNFCTA